MNILILTTGSFPAGAAISSRMLHFCKLFSHMGHQVHVIAMSSNEKIEIGRTKKMQGCTYQAVLNRNQNSFESFFGVKDYIKTVKTYLSQNSVDLIFASGIEPYFNRIIRACKKNNCLLLEEQCEWMDDSSYRFGRLDYRRIRRDKLLHGGFGKASGIVSISRLLDDHYRSLGISSTRIPTILDLPNTEFSLQTHNERVTLVYTGNPSTSKELFRPVFRAICNNPLLKDRIAFHIYGPNKQRVLANIGGDAQLMEAVKDNVTVHGRVPQEQIPEILRNADFQLFLRPSRRSSNAGFPTKFAEAMAVGTPVLTNDTGDIGLYLRDGENGILASGITDEAVEQALLRAAKLTEAEKMTMRQTARKTAEQSFDYRGYCDQMTEFIKSVK